MASLENATSTGSNLLAKLTPAPTPQKDHSLIESESEDELATSPVTLSSLSKSATSCKKRRMTLLAVPTSTSSVSLRHPPTSPTSTRDATRHLGSAQNSRAPAKTPRKVAAAKKTLNGRPPSQSTPTKDACPWDYDIYDVMATPETPTLSSPTANFEVYDAIQSPSSPISTPTATAQGLLGSVAFTVAEISTIIQDLEDVVAETLQGGDERLRMHIRLLRERLKE
ncbi:hypothetical protein CKAH01_08976 [Colletotrichum kahawae]|uniref:Uncharacterized protein n=1 Tax=Colletotrichum kahawae TaxID=34407 RepID=A0AAE0D0T2_COLKA|nr:hypothetical protein CKAH01_08976 [Colletotrichum kahawae]